MYKRQLEGTVFAVLQMVVYRQIARQAHVAFYLWAAALTLGVVGVLVADSNRALVGIVIAIVTVAAIPVTLARPSGRATAPAMARPQ